MTSASECPENYPRGGLWDPPKIFSTPKGSMRISVARRTQSGEKPNPQIPCLIEQAIVSHLKAMDALPDYIPDNFIIVDGFCRHCGQIISFDATEET